MGLPTVSPLWRQDKILDCVSLVRREDHEILGFIGKIVVAGHRCVSDVCYFAIFPLSSFV